MSIFVAFHGFDYPNRQEQDSNTKCNEESENAKGR